jgi:hypothetical protein
LQANVNFFGVECGMSSMLLLKKLTMVMGAESIGAMGKS